MFATHTLGFNHGRVSESLRNLGVEVIPTLRFLRIMRGLLLVLKHFQWIAGYRFVLWTGGVGVLPKKWQILDDWLIESQQDQRDTQGDGEEQDNLPRSQGRHS